jgi:hypothetical protein
MAPWPGLFEVEEESKLRMVRSVIAGTAAKMMANTALMESATG